MEETSVESEAKYENV